MDSVIDLNSFLQAIVGTTGLRICIHDVSGLLSCRHFRVEWRFAVHSGEICAAAKQTEKGMRLCLRCKGICNQKAFYGRAFQGMCPMGITEIVRPIQINGKTAAILYVGNILNQPSAFEKRLVRTCKFTGASESKIRNLMHTLYIAEDLDSCERIADAIIAYIQLLYRTYGAVPSNKRHWLVDNFLNYAQTQFAGGITLGELAKLYYVNEKYAGRLFKKHMGITFGQYLNQVRIQQACKLLASERKILDVAMDCGFGNLSYFNRTFKAATGDTPSQYRKKIQEETEQG